MERFLGQKPGKNFYGGTGGMERGIGTRDAAERRRIRQKKNGFYRR
jgi:hypothetical protein